MQDDADHVIAAGIEAAKTVVDGKRPIDERPRGDRQFVLRVQRAALVRRPDQWPERANRSVFQNRDMIIEKQRRAEGAAVECRARLAQRSVNNVLVINI